MEKRTVELEILTPVHIGSHEGGLTAYDYAISGDSLYVIHQGRLAEFLVRRGKVEEFERAVERKGREFDIGEFLSRFRDWEKMLETLSRYKIEAQERAGIRELRPHIRDASGRDYLPGSSIKGAMRTACAYVFLKSMKRERPDDFRKALRSIADKLSDRGSRRGRRDDKNLFKKLNEDFFQGFDIRHFLNKDKTPKHSPNTDVLRCLQVTDAYPVESRVAAINAKVLDKGPDGRLAEESPLYIEAVVSGIYRFEVSWDEWLAGKLLEGNRDRVESGKLIYPRGLNDVLSACREFVEDQLVWEEAFFRSCADDKGLGKSVEALKGRADFRLGWGSGLVGASISLLLPEDLKNDIRDRFFRNYDKRVRDFPKSRRVAYRGRVPHALMGFCRLREVTTA